MNGIVPVLLCFVFILSLALGCGNGNQVPSLNGNDGRDQVIENASNDVEKTQTPSSWNPIIALAVDRTGKWLVVASSVQQYTSMCFLWNLETKQLVSKWHTDSLVRTLHIDVERDCIIARGVIWIVEFTLDGKIKRKYRDLHRYDADEISPATGINDFALDKNWRFFTTVSFVSERVALPTNWSPLIGTDRSSGKTLFKIDGYPELVAVALDFDGELVATNGRENSVQVFDIETGQLQFRLKGHQSNVTDLAFSPDGGSLVSGDNAGELIVWDMKSKEIRHRWKSDLERILSIRFSHDGKFFAVRSSSTPDRFVNIFDTRDYSHVVRYSSFDGPFTFMPNKNQIVGALDTTISILDFDGKLIDSIELPITEIGQKK